MRWRDIFKRRPKPVIRFASYIGNFSIATPIREARRVRADWFKQQVAQKKKTNFATCPGMFDFAQAGFIVSAHVDIHIKANNAGVVVFLEGMPLLEPHENAVLSPTRFDFSIVDGLAPVADGLSKVAQKVPMPWAIFTEPGWSANVLPATMHCDYLDKIFVYPGTVDYDKFHTCNFIFTPIKECEFVIPAGTPLLQVIPFRREEVTMEFGRATQKDYDRHVFGTVSKVRGYYRKMFHSKKVYVAACPAHKKG